MSEAVRNGRVYSAPSLPSSYGQEASARHGGWLRARSVTASRPYAEEDGRK